MDPVSLSLAIPPLAELLLRLIPKIIKLIRKYVSADTLLAEKLVEFQDHAQKLQLELEEFRTLSPDLPTDIKQHIGRLFVVLRGKITAFEIEVDSFSDSRETPGLLGVKVLLSSVEGIVADVQNWQRRVEDYLELLQRWPKPFKDPRVANTTTAIGRVRLMNEAIFAGVESTPESLNLGEISLPQDLTNLPFSQVKIQRRPQLAIFEARPIGPKVADDKIEVMKRDVIDLARILSAEDLPNRGILRCTGYRYEELASAAQSPLPLRRFILEFEVPSNLRSPRSLRDVLLDKDFKGQILHPLNERLSLARQLARAVLHVHAKKHVHKNIRPDTILLLETVSEGGGQHDQRHNPKSFPNSLGTAFLVGFERIRKHEADTVTVDDLTWAEEIYRHPSRQGASHPDEKFNMLHDIYSLGVCLLELALWRSFIELDGAGNKINNTRACKLIEESTAGILPPRMLPPQKIQQKFIRDARNRVPNSLGQRFGRVVERCLTCVETFPADVERDPFVGLQYIDQVLVELEEIVL